MPTARSRVLVNDRLPVLPRARGRDGSEALDPELRARRNFSRSVTEPANADTIHGSSRLVPVGTSTPSCPRASAARTTCSRYVTSGSRPLTSTLSERLSLCVGKNQELMIGVSIAESRR